MNKSAIIISFLFLPAFLGCAPLAFDKSQNPQPVDTVNINSFLYTGEPIPGIEYASTDEDLINLYHRLISTGDLQNANRLRAAGNTNFPELVALYGNIVSAEERDISLIAPHRYQYTLVLTEKNGDQKRHKVITEAIGKRLKTLSSKEIEKEITYQVSHNDSISAYVEWKSGTERVIVEVDGERIVCDTIVRPDTHNIGRYFSDPRFSEDGDYLLYRDSEIVKIFDVPHRTAIDSVSLFAPSQYGISEDRKHLYACQSSGMDGGYLRIFSLPDAEITEVIPEGSGSILCLGYDKETNSIQYSTLTSSKGETRHEYFLRNAK